MCPDVRISHAGRSIETGLPFKVFAVASRQGIPRLLAEPEAEFANHAGLDETLGR